ncbi:MAG: AAA family ATPase [Myxococcota bacterium]
MTQGNNGRCRIVLTGGPGGGKTTAADLYRRELGEQVVVVPEAATLLFTGGFPRTGDPEALRSAQQAIFHVQRNLEDVQSACYPDRVLLCDRGTVDGAAYWPGRGEEYFHQLRTTLQAELARYDAVLFFESAAVGGLRIEGGNLARIEDVATAAALDERLRTFWSQHPRFILVPHQRSFLKKISDGLGALHEVLEQLGRTG